MATSNRTVEKHINRTTYVDIGKKYKLLRMFKDEKRALKSMQVSFSLKVIQIIKKISFIYFVDIFNHNIFSINASFRL